MVMDSIDAAWFAGLFEGEGNIQNAKGSNGVVLRINMTDLDILERVQKVTDAGNIYGPFKNGDKGVKPIWHWAIQYSPDVVRLLQIMRPFFGERRGQRADEALSRLAQVQQRSRQTHELVHGTLGGYQKHIRRGEKPCPECKKCQSDYMREWKRNKNLREVWTNPRGTRDGNVESGEAKPAEAPAMGA